MGSMVRQGDDFYEEDEAVGEIVEIFEKGEKRLTGAPERGKNGQFHLSPHAAVVAAAVTTEGGTSGAPAEIRLLPT